MSEFTELATKKDVSDMTEEEARETLSEFMEEHQKNKEAYDERETEFSEKLSEKEETIETLQERLTVFHKEKAKEAAKYANLPVNILAERFEFSDLEQIIKEAEEAGVEGDEDFTEDETDEEDEDEPLTNFANREQKGQKVGSGPTKKHRERAKAMLRNNDFPARD